jgi:hypothetical protein
VDLRRNLTAKLLGCGVVEALWKSKPVDAAGRGSQGTVAIQASFVVDFMSFLVGFGRFRSVFGRSFSAGRTVIAEYQTSCMNLPSAAPAALYLERVEDGENGEFGLTRARTVVGCIPRVHFVGGWSRARESGMRMGKYLAVVGFSALATLAMAPTASATLIINEVDSDSVNSPSTDAFEFLELYNTDGTAMSLDGLVLVLYNGNGNRAYYVQDLDGLSTRADGYFVAGAGIAGADLAIPTNTIQNGADAVAIYTGNGSDFTTGATGTLAHSTNLIDSVVYKTGNDTDGVGLAAALSFTGGEVDEFGRDGTAASGALDSIGRFPNGSGALHDAATWTVGAPTPGAANQPVPEPTTAALLGVAGGMLGLRRRR